MDALLLAVTLAALVFAAGFSVYHTRMTRWQLQNLQVDLERLNVEVINLKYKDPLGDRLAAYLHLFRQLLLGEPLPPAQLLDSSA